MIDEQEVGFLRNFVETAIGLRKEIPHLDRAIWIQLLKRLGQISGRRVVSLSEGGGQDQDRAFGIFTAHIRKYWNG